MYTQCPDCSTAFRVTAEILRKAAGKVRCGGCGNAFNALDYLSESMPEPARAKEVEDELPELTPEPVVHDDGKPASISAEQSAALLKTLDELAGSDIRIEDTGVEWRVLDDNEVGEAAADEIAVDIEVEDQPSIDEILEDSPTPVDQFLTETPPQVDSPEIFEDADDPSERSPVDELRFDDNTPLPDDFDLDDEASYAPQPDARPEQKPEPEPVVAAEPQVDLDLSDPDEWTDILDEFEGLAEELADPEPSVADELAGFELADDEEPPESAPRTGDTGEPPPDMDSQFALQAEAMGIDLSGMHETLDEEPGADVEDDLEALLDASNDEARDLDDLLEEDRVDDEVPDDDAAQLELIDEEDDEAFWEKADAESETGTGAETENDLEPEDEIYVPPLTEEEQTINMQIDQDLLAIAVEDKDGFASTMVLPEDIVEARVDEQDDATEDEDIETEQEQILKDTGAGFETIVMEGEAFRSALDDGDQDDNKAAAAKSLAIVAEAKRASEEEARAARKRKYSIAAAIAALALLLALQGIHQARNTLATIPAFNSVVGPMYRALGKPLSPDWDITGWRFEVTDGRTDAENANLAIVSRLGNRSETPLPYPIIAVSLADRFEEPLGSVTLGPTEYLAENLDPRELVEPGNSFQANFVVSSLPENATTYRLRACYQAPDGQLRCKEDDFK